MATLQKIYSDIDFTFTKKPVTGDVALSYDSQAVIRSVRNLASTNFGERLFNPSLGSNMQTLLFEPISPTTQFAIEKEIENVIRNYEPRVILKSVVATADEERNAYNLTVTFYLENAATPTTVTFLLERNR